MTNTPEFIKNFLKTVPVDANDQQTNGKTPRKRKQKKVWTIETQDAFLTKHNIEAKEREPYKDGDTKRQLAKCPFCENSDHNTCVYLNDDGVAGFSCSHNSCKGKYRWHQFREHFEPPVEPYEYTEIGMMHTNDKGETIKISNFGAELVSDIVTDDGAEQNRSYEVRALLLGRSLGFEVPASQFAACDWIDQHLGSRAIVTTGNSMRSHLVNAIKSCSDPHEQFHYAHTGWRKVDDTSVYLHAKGGISQVSQVVNKNNKDLTNFTFFSEEAPEARLGGPKNTISQVSQVSQVNMRDLVKLTGSLTKYDLPEVQDLIIHTIRASLRVLDLAADVITAPIYAAIWRAVLGNIDFGLHLAGQTGWGKTELCALAQQHYGPAMDAHHLPGSWESTENSLEMLLFQAKDVVVVVDDFKPKGSRGDQDRLHAKADRVFRQIGNGSARGRLTSNLDQRPERRPRCMLISTGEDIPRGQSLKARGVVVNMSERITEGDSAKKLSDAQKDARRGIYAQAMSAYLEWLAPLIESIQAQMPELISAERDRLSISGHARSGTNTANLMIGMKFFLQFAYEMGAITVQDAQIQLLRCQTALIQLAGEAAQENTHDRPTEQWKRLVVAAIANKSAHLATANGKCPGLQYGWVTSVRNSEFKGEMNEEETLRGGGNQIGWIDGEDLYLLPDAAYKAAKDIGSRIGGDITTIEGTLRKFLVQDGMLASTDIGRPRNTILVRRTLEKIQREVLHIKKSVFFPPDPPPENLTKLTNLTSESLKPAFEAASAVEEFSQVDAVSQVKNLTKVSREDITEEVDERLVEVEPILRRQPSLYWRGLHSSMPPDTIGPDEYMRRLLICLDSGDSAQVIAANEDIERRTRIGRRD